MNNLFTKWCRVFVLIALLSPIAAHAGMVDAKEVARMNNCLPKKIDVYDQTLGEMASTVYRVECNLPKTSQESAAPKATAVLIRCKGDLCELLRPLSPENK